MATPHLMHFLCAHMSCAGPFKSSVCLHESCMVPLILCAPPFLLLLLQNQLHDVARTKPMTATATRMVKAVWFDSCRPAAGEEEGEAGEAPAAKAVEEDENEEEAEDDVAEDALAATDAKQGKKAAAAVAAKKKKAVKAVWVGAVAKTEQGDKFYCKAKVRGCI